MDGLKRNENGTFAEGTAPGPGRPKGQSLKEYWQKRFYDMTDDEKIEFSQKVGALDLWKMAEGNASNNTDVTSGGQPIEAIIGMRVMKDADAINSICPCSPTVMRDHAGPCIHNQNGTSV